MKSIHFSLHTIKYISSLLELDPIFLSFPIASISTLEFPCLPGAEVFLPISFEGGTVSSLLPMAQVLGRALCSVEGFQLLWSLGCTAYTLFC